jgi:Ca-activated chloride channel family protein
MPIAALMDNLVLASPAWLMLMGVAPLLFLVGLSSLGDFSRAQLAAQAILRTLVLAGVALALARPALRRDATEISVVALADVSDSVSPADLEVERRLVRAVEDAAARRPLGRGIAPRVVRFGKSPEEVSPPESGRRASEALGRFAAPGAGAGTDLALAIGLGSGLFDPTGLPRMLIISDGETTSGDALAEAERAAARGVRIDVHTLTASADQGDVAVESLTAPDEVRPHAPFDLAIHLVTDRAGSARLRLERDGQPNLPEAERTVALARGANVVTWTARVEDAGTSIFRARVVSATHDSHTENDQGVLAIATERDPRVLYVEGELAAAASFARALEAEKIAVDVRGARGLPGRVELDRYDLVVLSDVPRSALTDRQMQALEGFVRDGGGLLMAGGAASFGSGGWAGSRLEALLPVRLDLPEKLDEATLALALVIDKSGSMSGPKMELTKEAARATAEMMPPNDQIAVVVFDSQSAPVVRLQRAANRARIVADISRIQASGGTNILAGLREAVDELLAARARKKHVILLSDGQSSYEGINDLLESASNAQITVSAVGVGDGADQALLQMIATRGGGRFYQTRDPASIPRIFSRETSQIARSSIVEAPTTVRTRKHAELLAGLALETAPQLRGYALTRPRAQADLILATGSGDPLLARWQIGLGLVAAWTSDVKARWSADWLRWSGFGKFWAQVARTTMRRRAANHFPLRAALDGESVSVSVDAVGADDRFMGGLEGTLEITTATATASATATAAASAPDAGPGTGAPPGGRTVRLLETAPGRYEANFSIDRGNGADGGPGDAGSLLLKATLRRAGLPVADAAGRLAIPFAPELRPRLTVAAAGPSAALAAIAARTGGHEIADASHLFDAGQERRTTLQPLRTQILLATLVLFLVDVLLRRVNLNALIRRLRGAGRENGAGNV